VSGPVPDTLASLAAKIDAIPDLSASVMSSRLHIMSDLGYEFDFMPALLPEPETSNLTGAPPPSVAISGLYREDTNQRFTFTAVGTGAVGNGDLRLDVTNESGVIVSTLNVGSGYAAGDAIELANGIKIALSTGDLNDGDTFVVQALATSDTSGFLAAAGLNTFFSGASASEIRVCDSIAEAPGRVATAFGGDLTDNLAALRLAEVREEAVADLTGLAPGEYYHRMVANLGQQVHLKESRQQNIDAMIQDLNKQRDDISGVNINDEAANLMIFEKMFQAVAKYMTSLQSVMTSLMELV
jgi:flagellar hook-associated protein 1 FlgK